MLIDCGRHQLAGMLRALERQNFAEPKARMQWWYLDVFMADGSVLVAAFVPRKWWPDSDSATTDEALFFLALLDAEREVKAFSKTLTGPLRCTASSLEIPGALCLTMSPNIGRWGSYRLELDMDGIAGSLEFRREAAPFSPLPFGRLPGLARALVTRSGLRARTWSYVAQMPRGSARGVLTIEGQRHDLEGLAYHEQGRFDDAPERLNNGWLWVHFLHPRWNIFGSPGTFLCVYEDGSAPLFRGLELFERNTGLKSTTTLPELSQRVFSGGRIRLARKGRVLSITADPASARPLISFPSVISQQLWHTLVTDAELVVEAGEKVDRYQGRIVLETCCLARA